MTAEHQEPTKVIFVCFGCEACYEAAQIPMAGKGVFRCHECETQVHVWDEAYSYLRWQKYDSTE